MRDKKEIRRVTTIGSARVKVGVELLPEHWEAFKAKAKDAGQSMASRMAWLIRRDLTDSEQK